MEFGKGLFGRLWLFAGGFRSFVFVCWRLVVVSGHLLVVYGGLWSSPVLLTMFLKPFLEFKCYLILIYILIYIWVINDKIYFYCFLCVVVITTEKKNSTMSIGKISWLFHLRHGDITNMEIYLSWGYNYANHGDIIIEISISWRYNYIMEI